jgi:hypothetical protein
MQKTPSAFDIVAFGVINFGVDLPIELLFDMSPDDLLYQALMKAWKDKEEREDRRNALLCCIIANVQGNKTKVEDFMPKTSKTIEETESELKANLMKYNAVAESIK